MNENHKSDFILFVLGYIHLDLTFGGVVMIFWQGVTLPKTPPNYTIPWYKDLH